MRLKLQIIFASALLILILIFSPLWLGAQDPQSAAPAQVSSGLSDQDSSADSASRPKDLPVDYIIGPEDVFDIEVFGLPELSKTVRVANDGTISLPLIGRIKAAGLTSVELRKALEDKWGEQYVQNPQVSVFVREFHAQPVSVIGAVERPGIYQLIGSRSLIELLSMAGGLAKRTSSPAGRTLFITRKGGFGDLQPVEGMQLVSPEKLEVDIPKLLYSREDKLNIQIKPFDVVSVSKADVVYVVGDVRKPGGFVLEDKEKITVLQALALAEGLNGTAAKGATRIIRRSDDGSQEEIPVDLKKVLKGKAVDVELAASDILIVPTSSGKAALKRGAEAVLGTVTGVIIYRR